MLKNYFKIAWRNLERNKLYSFINIFGLAIGLAVCMLIVLYVGHESSYDRFHKNADRMVSVQGKLKIGNDSIFVEKMSYATATLGKAYTPSVESFIRMFKDYRQPVIQNPQLPQLRFSENSFLFADSNFFGFFSFHLIKGNKKQALAHPYSVVISPKMAGKYFGKEDPVGKTIRYNSNYLFTVTGVAEKAPSNSSIQFDFIASLSSLLSVQELKQFAESPIVQAGSFSTYFLLNNKTAAPALEASLLQLNRSSGNGGNERFIASPFLNTHLKGNFGDSSNTKYITIFPFVAAFVLLLALINYISLATSRSAIRSKEIGVRKVMGASRSSIAMQFFTESALYTAISFALGYLLCTLFQPVFFNFLQIDVDNSFLHNSRMLLWFAILFILTVLIASTYPSLLLSAYKPVAVLYGKFSKKNGGVSVRKFFTVFQFTVSMLLIISGIVIDRQMYFFRHADTGVNRENIVMVPFSATIGKHYSTFSNEAAALPSFQQTAASHYPMYKGYDMFFTKAKNSSEDISIANINVDRNFISLLGLQWKIKPSDSFYYRTRHAVLLNEAAVEKLNLGSTPLNETLTMGNGLVYTVAGVLKDFNYQSLEGKIGALCLFILPAEDSLSLLARTGGCFFAKLGLNANTGQAIQQLKRLYEKYDSAQPFEYYFMDEAFDAMYKAEDRLAKIFSVFTAFTLLIACMGLFGLSTFMALQRTKEVGIRKVLGASVSQITSLLSKEFLKLVVIAIVIASPIAWWMMNKWLETFAYRIAISWWIFIAAGATAILIALFTISFQAIKTAVANPVKSLRSE
ncbi:MAG: ABC transporter permease [Bacteroidota bacterium]